jgi:hypothetical protein
MKTFTQWIILFLGGAIVASAQNSTIMLHTGATDPVTEGFGLVFRAPASVGPVIGDFGTDAWRTYADGAVSYLAAAWYQRGLTGEQFTQINHSDWDLDFTMRIGQDGACVNFNTGVQLYSMFFSVAGDFLLAGFANGNLIALRGQAGGYHRYRLAYDFETDSATLFVDDVSRIADAHGTPLSPGGFGGLVWGQVPNGRVSEAYWSSVSLTIIPEPSPSHLLLLGCGLFVRVRFKPESS